MRRLQADIIVVGAGSAGSFFAWRSARAGLAVLVLEKRPLSELGAAIEVFHMDQRAFGEFGIPEPLPPELLHLETEGFMWSPDRKVRERVHYPFYVMNLPLFLGRLHGYCREAGVGILEGQEAKAPIVEGGAVVGVAGEDFEARASLVVDASGMAGGVRTKLPPGLGIETAPIDPADIYSCCLELRTGTGPEGLTGSNSFIHQKGFWNRSYGDDIIIGLSRPADYDHTWERHRAFREEYFGDPGRVVARRQGKVPFRRSLLSCVGPGVLVIGDAAFQNRPFSGEGVVSGIAASAIAARVAVAALGSGGATAAALWPYNVEYFRGQGRLFAAAFAQLPAAAGLSEKDIGYLYRKGLLFSGKDFEDLNRTYEMRMGPGRLPRMGLILLGGVLAGQFGRASLRALLAASAKAGRLKRQYQDYPVSPDGFPDWKAKALELWGEGSR